MLSIDVYVLCLFWVFYLVVLFFVSPPMPSSPSLRYSLNRTICSNARSSDHIDTSGVDPLVKSGTMNCEAYKKHPVIVGNTGHWSDVEIMSIFCDGVQYTKRDSFIGFYIRNLRTHIEEMVFVVRTLHHI